MSGVCSTMMTSCGEGNSSSALRSWSSSWHRRQRDRLACEDQPPICLSADERQELQISCLYYYFCNTEAG